MQQPQPSEHDIAEASRVAGLGRVVRPTLQDVERRRFELVGLSLFMLVALASGVVLLSFAPSSIFDELGALNAIRAGVLLLAVTFGALLVEKNRQLQKVSDLLINERVLSSALVNRLRELRLLHHAGRAAMSDLAPEQSVNVILASACELLDADEGSVMVVDGDELELAAAYGRTELFVGQRRVVTEGIAGYVVRSREPLLLEGQLDMLDLRFVIERPQGRDTVAQSSITVPLEARGDVIGVLSVSVTDGSRRFQEYDRYTLELFAHHAAVAILQKRPQDTDPGLTASAEDLDRLRFAMVDRIAGDIECLGDGVGVVIERPKRPLKVLVVDDDPSLLHMVQVALEARGHMVILASDGETALDRISAEHPDVVLLDFSIPVMDGWRLLEQIRERPDRPRTICVTGKHNRRDRIRAWTLGCDEYVTKPFDTVALLDLVDAIVLRTAEEQDEQREEALRTLFAVG